MPEQEVTIQVDVKRQQNGTVARVTGPASLINVDELSRSLLKLSAHHPKLVVFDMSGCTFICSLAIGSFVEFSRGLKSHNGEVRFAGLNQSNEAVFRKLNLQHVFALHRTTDEALAPAN